MPLPQFLRYRLAKRGIIQSAEDTDKSDALPASLGEEVIAEDYDNPKKNSGKGGGVDDSAADELLSEIQLKLWGHPGCPNKYNIYHECSAYCKEHWGAGHVEADPKYLKLRAKMLLKYPLPMNWVEVYDPGTGRYYYWEYESDFVSWLPPGHPRAVISESAPFLRDALLPEEEEDDDDDDDGKGSNSDDDDQEHSDERSERHKDDKGRKRYRDDESRQDKHSGDERKRESHDRHKKSWRKDSDDEDVKEPRSKEWKRDSSERHKSDAKDRHKEEKERKRDDYKSKGWKKAFDKTLDPMDPAAYSDTPRGTWSSGIERKNEAKTGADTTASGPLYQMRPYPSPGAVLRANSTTSKAKHTREAVHKPASVSKPRRDT